jgi:hypothetical protein
VIKDSIKNRKDLEYVGEGYCYYCLSHVKLHEIVEWTDSGDTAICPVCLVDSILPGNVSERKLRELNREAFGD